MFSRGLYKVTDTLNLQNLVNTHEHIVTIIRSELTEQKGKHSIPTKRSKPDLLRIKGTEGII